MNENHRLPDYLDHIQEAGGAIDQSYLDKRAADEHVQDVWDDLKNRVLAEGSQNVELE